MASKCGAFGCRKPRSEIYFLTSPNRGAAVQVDRAARIVSPEQGAEGDFRMRTLLLCGLIAFAAACTARDVGIWDSSRMFAANWCMDTGSDMTMSKGAWESRGAVWHRTTTLTPAFLSTISVFYTGMMANAPLSTSEQAALLSWVQAGNTLVVTTDCV